MFANAVAQYPHLQSTHFSARDAAEFQPLANFDGEVLRLLARYVISQIVGASRI